MAEPPAVNFGESLRVGSLYIPAHGVTLSSNSSEGRLQIRERLGTFGRLYCDCACLHEARLTVLKVGTGIAWLDDIQAFYRERALIEKEYAGKLNALAKKYHEKKAKKSVPLTAGETPTITPGSLEKWASPVPALVAEAPS